MKPEKPSSEPSMDEILASIRQIISTDPKKEKKHGSPPKDQEDILDLTEVLPEDISHTSSPVKAQKPEVSMDEKKEEPKPKPVISGKEEPSPLPHDLSKPHYPLPKFKEEISATVAKDNTYTHPTAPSEKRQGSEVPSIPSLDGPLVSQAAMSEAAQALHSLNKLAQDRPRIPEPRLNTGIGGQTVEELVREILRPLLKEWLDANLPTLVKWVVNEQVEKIVRQLGVTPHESTFEKPKDPPKF